MVKTEAEESFKKNQLMSAKFVLVSLVDRKERLAKINKFYC